MKTFTLIILITIVGASVSKAQDTILYRPSEVIRFDTVPHMVTDAHFLQAYNEMAEMMEKEEKYNFKRAVFLVDWAYNDGKPSYENFCHEIDSITTTLKAFIRINDAYKYKTAPNWAIFEYFTKSNPMNGNKPFVYDFDDFMGKQDFNKLLVTKILKTHTGQCTSMPLLYKILCDELGGHSKLALAPSHLYIKHIGEDGRWVNVELTNGCFARDEWYMQTFGISTEAIKNGVFLCAFSNKENIAFIMQLLASSYQHKYRNYDYFTLNCSSKALEYAPNFSQALVIKYLNLASFKKSYIQTIGKKKSDYIIRVNKEMHATLNVLDSIGYSQISDEEYQQNVERALKETETMKAKDR